METIGHPDNDTLDAIEQRQPLQLEVNTQNALVSVIVAVILRIFRSLSGLPKTIYQKFSGN